MPQITLRIDADIRTDWNTHCASIGVVPSERLRRFIQDELDEQSGSAPARTSSQPALGQPKKKLGVWFTVTEINAIKQRSIGNGGSMAGWIRRICTAALTGEPQLNDAEIKALNESSLQLKKVGTNLNQIARRLNDLHGQQIKNLQDSVAGIDALRDTVDMHIARADMLIDKAQRHYTIEES